MLEISNAVLADIARSVIPPVFGLTARRAGGVTDKLAGVAKHPHRFEMGYQPGIALENFDDGTCTCCQSFFYLNWRCFKSLNLGTVSIE